MSDSQILSSAGLYEDVWSIPLVAAAKKHGVRPVKLAWACDRLGVPLPPYGHWQQICQGKKPPRSPMREGGGPQSLDLANNMEAIDRYAADDEVNGLIRGELAREQIIVPNTLKSPHPLIAGLVETHRLLTKHPYRRGESNADHYKVLEIRRQVPAADVSATERHRTRAWRIMDTLLKAMEVRGYVVRNETVMRQSVTQITVLGQSFCMRLHEPSRRAKPSEIAAKPPEYWYLTRNLIPTGKLCLKLQGDYRWSNVVNMLDGARPLEKRLRDFIVAILRQVDRRRLEDGERSFSAIAQAKARQERERVLELQRAQEEVRKKEESRVAALFKEIASWRQAREIRDYAQAVRETVASRGNRIVPGGRLDTWLTWAEEVALRYDPLRVVPLRDAANVTSEPIAP